MRRVPRTLIVPTALENGPHKGFLAALVRGLVEAITVHASRLNLVLPTDGTEAMTAPLELMTYTVATEPAAADYEGTVIYVSDGGTGAVFRGSDGAAWVNLG